MNYKFRPLKNYYHESFPIFFSNSFASRKKATGSIKAITWNIKISQHIDRAIRVLSEKPMQNLDILFLQEMDETGIEKIAKEFHLNYVYIPSTCHVKHGKNFGNAVLSPWHLSNPKKLILPFRNSFNKQIRCTTICTMRFGNKEILVSSIHTELITINITINKKYQQINQALNTLATSNYRYILAGGDFNTITKKGLRTFEEIVTLNKFICFTPQNQHTFSFLKFPRTLDHIIGRGFTKISTGVYTNPHKASDHKPVWVVLKINPTL